MKSKKRRFLDLGHAAAGAMFHVIPAPLEKTVSYGKGTARGPAAILDASTKLELFDGEGVPSELGIHTRPPVDCSGPMETALANIGKAVAKALDKGAIPVTLGGEHSVTIGAIAPFAKSFGCRLGLVQFDAHSDLRDKLGGSRWSHGCVMRRAHDMDVRLFQLGIRSMSPEEVVFRQERHIERLDAWDILEKGLPDPFLPADFPPLVYVTFDVDALDPSLMPATGTPEPGGLSWHHAMKSLGQIARDRQVVGMDFLELAPIPGMAAPDFTVARLVYNAMGMVGRANSLR